MSVQNSNFRLYNFDHYSKMDIIFFSFMLPEFLGITNLLNPSQDLFCVRFNRIGATSIIDFFDLLQFMSDPWIICVRFIIKKLRSIFELCSKLYFGWKVQSEIQILKVI